MKQVPSPSFHSGNKELIKVTMMEPEFEPYESDSGAPTLTLL